MKDKILILHLFEFLNKKRNKEMPFIWTATNFPDSIPNSEYLSRENIMIFKKRINEIPKFILRCKNLKILDLSWNNIKKIENLENCKKLERLDLSYNAIETLNGLPEFNYLHQINLRSNEISAEEINKFTKSHLKWQVYS